MGLAKKGGKRSGTRSLLHFSRGYLYSQSLFLVGTGMAVLRRGNRSSHIRESCFAPLLSRLRIESFFLPFHSVLTISWAVGSPSV